MGRDETFLTSSRGNFGLEHGPLSNPLANLQISPCHCFQEVCSHQPRMQEMDLGPLRELQVIELDGRMCMRLCACVFTCDCMCKRGNTCAGVYVSLGGGGDDTVRKGVVRKP